MTGMTLNVDENLVKPIIEQKIQAAIVEALCKTDQAAIIGNCVSHVLNQKVGDDGKPSNYSYYTTTYIQWLCQSAIKDSARKAVVQWVEDNKAKFEAQFLKELNKNSKSFSRVFFDGLMDSMKSAWQFKLDVKFETPKD